MNTGSVSIAQVFTAAGAQLVHSARIVVSQAMSADGKFLHTRYLDGTVEIRNVEPLEQRAPEPIKTKPLPELIPEVWQESPPDADRAMSLVRDLCRGVG